MKLRQIAVNPWDFTLYESPHGSFVLKVMFSNGQYKTDIGRYFAIHPANIDVTNVDELKLLAARIRAEHHVGNMRQLDPATIAVLR